MQQDRYWETIVDDILAGRRSITDFQGEARETLEDLLQQRQAKEKFEINPAARYEALVNARNALYVGGLCVANSIEDAIAEEIENIRAELQIEKGPA